jgi:hypothetical protein
VLNAPSVRPIAITDGASVDSINETSTPLDAEAVQLAAATHRRDGVMNTDK